MVLAAASLSIRVQSNIGLIRGGVARGLTSNQIQGLIRATGQAGIRRTELLAGMRHASGITESAFRIRSVRMDRLPDPMRIEIAKGRMIRNYSYEVRIRGRHPDTGEMTDLHITVRSDKNLTPREILEQAETVLDEAPQLVPYAQLKEDRTMTIIGAKRRG